MYCWENLPDIFIQRLKKIIPVSNQQDVLDSFCKPKTISFRINPLITTADEIKKTLLQNGIEAKEVPWYQNAFIINPADKTHLISLDLYRKGYFYIQNLSSMLPAIILNAKPYESVLDIAAAPGSKTSQIAQFMENKGEIIANDISKVRLFKLKSILLNQGITNVKISQIPGEYIWKKYPNHFDKVLVDAPCTMEARFDGSHTKSYQDWSFKKVKVLSLLQKRLLRSAFYCTKPGGIIIYSTCTFSPEENEEVVEWLLKEEGKHVRLEGIEFNGINSYHIGKWNNKEYPAELRKTLRVLPDNNMEGFFLAKISRLT